MKSFYAPGKVLISGEYFILDGAWGLALPTRFGQGMEIEEIEVPYLFWTSYLEDGSIWYQHDFNLKHGKVSTHRTDDVTQQLLKFLNEAHLLNPQFLATAPGYKVKTHLEFPRDWGLGSSSTLIHALSEWAGIDPFELLSNSFKGSGYDVAIAKRGTPLLFRLKNGSPEIKEVALSWNFCEHLYFLHLNKKTDTQEEISHFGHKLVSDQDGKRIDAISKELVEPVSLANFRELLEEHESILAKTLEAPTIKKQLFSDFEGTIKSMGAWGGDFVLVVTEEDPRSYFKEKGYNTLLSYNELIK